jgi:hypothetical protein
VGQSSRTQYAEFVSFWIRHNDPGNISLTDLNSGGTEFLEALNLHVLIVWAKVEVDSVLPSLHLAAGHQSQSCRPLRVNEEVAAGGARPDMFKVED